MRISKLILIVAIISLSLMISCVGAADLDGNSTVASQLNEDNLMDGHSAREIYVDCENGNDLNDGNSADAPVKSFNQALNLAEENSTIYLSDGDYKGSLNTNLVINKSVTVIGSSNTNFDGENVNSLFTINDNLTVSFRNINFINSFKKPQPYSNEIAYGAALDIKDAKVTVEKCSFINNVISHESTVSKYIYGGAISNFGDLSVIDSYFFKNSIMADSGIFGHGGAIYNRARLSVNNSLFEKSYSNGFGNGAAIANDGELLINNSVIRDSYALQEGKGSAIYNSGQLIIINSIIENNTCSRLSYQFIMGAIYNSGDLTAYGNIFRKNGAIYTQPMDFYKGSPTIYNVGNLNLTYNAFMDNAPYAGISRDVYFNGGKIIDVNNNWWQTNENPFADGTRINVDEVDSWFVFSLSPDYSKLNIGESADIKAFWTLSNGRIPQINAFPLFNVSFECEVDGEKLIIIKQLTGGNAVFNFNRTQNKGSYNITATAGGFSQSVLVDVGKISTHLRFNVTDDVTYLDGLIIDVEVTSDDSNVPSGIVNLNVGKNSYPINLTGGKGSIKILNTLPGTYDIKFTYEGNDDYFKAFNSTEVRIHKSPVNLTVTAEDIYIDGKGTLNVNLGPVGAEGQAILYVDGERKKIVYLNNGNTDISLNNFAEGQYIITIAYAGSNVYEASNASCIFNVRKYGTSLNITVHDINIGENATVLIVASPDDLRGKAILSINGVNTTIFLANATTAVNLHSLGAGRYDVCVIFEGDNKYYPSNASSSFKVSKSSSDIAVDVIQNDDDLNGTIIVKANPSGCTGIVGVYINYRLYELNLTDGIATFNVEFDKGTNYIFVYYRGDANYESATWNTTIGVADEFILTGQNATAYEYNNFNYTVRLVEYNGIPMPGRQVCVEFEGKTYNLTTNDDGIAYLTLNLNAGQYDISVSYLNETVFNKINIKNIEFNLTAVNITYGEKEIVEVSFENNITGKIRFIIPGILDESVDIADGKARYEIDLGSGSYTVIARYSNDVFTSDDVTSSFTVHKANMTLSIEIPSTSPGKTQTVKLITSKNATGSILIKVDGFEHSVDIKNNEAILNIENIREGTHIVEITYDGDENYNSYSCSTSFYVKEFKTDVLVEINDEEYGKSITAIARVDENATGNITFKVDKLSKTVKINNGVAIWSFSGIDVGNHTIEAKYGGNDNFMESSNTTSFNVLKANSSITLFTLGAYLNENIKIYANLSSNATGHVLFSMEGYYSPRYKEITNSMSLWYIEPLSTGNYTVYATYSGDNNYYSSSTTFVLEIYQRKAILDVEINDAGVNDMVVAKVKLYSVSGEKITSKVTLKIASKLYTLNIVNGEGSLNFGKFSPGNYTYSANYEGSEEFSKDSVEGKFQVVDDLLEVSLTSNNLTKYYMGSEKLSAKLSYLNNPIANAKVQIKISGSKYVVTTNSRGECFLPINLKPGTYSAEIIFEETGTYKSSKVNIVVKVLRTVEGSDVVKIYGTNTQYQAIFLDSNGKALGNTEVKFTLSGKSYTMKTLPNGIAKININLKAGKYIITTKNPVTGETASNTITMCYRLSENKDMTKYYGDSVSYKVRAFNDNGKPVGAGVIVKISVSGKTYSVKTDKNGYAALAINLKPNTYTITAEYKGFKVSNKITIKPVLTANSISKKQSKTTTFQAKLVDSKGKALSGKKITFKIDGRTFTANTNSNGIASVVININLRIGTHNIVSSYGKSTITNKIIVTK